MKPLVRLFDRLIDWLFYIFCLFFRFRDWSFDRLIVLLIVPSIDCLLCFYLSFLAQLSFLFWWDDVFCNFGSKVEHFFFIGCFSNATHSLFILLYVKPRNLKTGYVQAFYLTINCFGMGRGLSSSIPVANSHENIHARTRVVSFPVRRGTMLWTAACFSRFSLPWMAMRPYSVAFFRHPPFFLIQNVCSRDVKELSELFCPSWNGIQVYS